MHSRYDGFTGPPASFGSGVSGQDFVANTSSGDFVGIQWPVTGGLFYVPQGSCPGGCSIE